MADNEQTKIKELKKRKKKRTLGFESSEEIESNFSTGYLERTNFEDDERAVCSS